MAEYAMDEHSERQRRRFKRNSRSRKACKVCGFYCQIQQWKIQISYFFRLRDEEKRREYAMFSLTWTLLTAIVLRRLVPSVIYARRAHQRLNRTHLLSAFFALSKFIDFLA
jgi:hypothetical protein